MIQQEIVAIDRIYEKGRITIDWFLGKRCNFDCSYCTPHIHDNSSPHIPLDNLKYAVNALLEKIDPSRLKISFSGGEPTIHPQFDELCRYIHEAQVANFTLISNGSRTADYYIGLFKYIKRCTFSQHFEFTKASAFIKKMKQINDSLPEKKHSLVQVMFHAKYFEDIKKSVEFYQKHGIRYTLRKIRSKGKVSPEFNSYTDEMLAWFFNNQPQEKYAANTTVFLNNPDKDIIEKHDVNANEISGSEKNNFKNWTCWAGMDHLHIWFDGTVHRGNCRQGGPLGSIIDKSFTVPTEPVVCQTHLCFCAPEIMVKKVSHEKFKKLLS